MEDPQQKWITGLKSTKLHMQKRARKLRYGIFFADVSWQFIALVPAFGLVNGFSELLDGLWIARWQYYPILVTGLLGWALVYNRLELDGFRRGWAWGKVSAELMVGTSILAGIMAAGAYLMHDFVPRLILLCYACTLFAGFVAIRVFVHMGVLARRDKPNRRIVIIGNGRVARELALKIERHREMLCEVVGFLYPSAMEPDSVLGNSELEGVPVQALSAIDMLSARGVTDIVVVLSGQAAPHDTLDLVARCRQAGIHVSLVPQSYELYVSRPSLLDIDGLPILSLDKAELNPLSLVTKRVIDLVLATIIGICTLPLILVSAGYLQLRRGRAFTRELRCGRHGRKFYLYRLNVDRCVCDSSAFERLLHRMSMTELPQIVNVLMGDMSVVGPRPESPERVKHYSEWQRQRLGVRPGMTGLAQVHGLREQNTSEEKARFDLQYMLSWSPFMDFTLVIQTLWTLVWRVCQSDPRQQSAKRNMSSYPGFDQC